MYARIFYKVEELGSEEELESEEDVDESSGLAHREDEEESQEVTKGRSASHVGKMDPTVTTPTQRPQTHTLTD